MNKRERTEALRRLAGPASSSMASAPAGEPAERVWTMEHLLEHPALRGMAQADWRFHGNRSARNAAASLNHAVQQLRNAQLRNAPTDEPPDAA